MLNGRDVYFEDIRERVRSVTMDSEDMDEALTEIGLVYDDPLNDMTDKLNTMRRAEKFCDVTLKVHETKTFKHDASPHEVFWA